MIAKMVLANMQQFRRELEQADKNRRKAATIAARVEAFRLRNVLKKELRSGSPGGHPLPELRKITTSGRNRRPLARLAKAVRYWQHGIDGQAIISIGFNDGAVAGMSGRATRGNQLSKSWVRIAFRQQEGYETDPDAPTSIGSSTRKLLRNIGKDMPKRVRQFYFLRKSTTRLRTPARPIIDPFWRAHAAEASRNILANFARKMRGERI